MVDDEVKIMIVTSLISIIVSIILLIIGFQASNEAVGIELIRAGVIMILIGGVLFIASIYIIYRRN